MVYLVVTEPVRTKLFYIRCIENSEIIWYKKLVYSHVVFFFSIISILCRREPEKTDEFWQSID